MSFYLKEYFWLRQIARLVVPVMILILIILLALFIVGSLLPNSSGQLAFESNLDGNWDIYILDIYRNILFNLTRHPADDLGPAWSPQNGQIAFYSDRDSETGTEIYVMNTNGSEIHRITQQSGSYWRPNWSPDGKQLIFLLDYGNIQIMNMVGQNTSDFTYGFAPVWSPIDSRIAFYADRQGDLNGEVYLMDADGRNYHNLTQNAAHDWEPTWSPNGQRIAFVSSRDGNAEIYMMDAACDNPSHCGENVHRLTQNRAPDKAPAWSLNGQQIAFESESDGSPQIYIINTDGTSLQQLTHNQASNRSPIWWR
jgi:Tol biopolymer transport system component